MQQTNEMQNTLIKNSMEIFNALSFYSPIIICVSIVTFSMFTATMQKAFVFFVWIFLITFIRIIAFKGLKSTNQPEPNIRSECLVGLTQMFIPKDVSYSTYILTFTMMYFITPMILLSAQSKTNAMNYGVLSFFVAYIALDLFIKTNLECIPKLFSMSVIGNILSGLFLGACISGLLMYGTSLKKYLYVNEINSNNEVCSVPSNQQFKCRLFKNGELVGNI
jgi:hypothetical protein